MTMVTGMRYASAVARKRSMNVVEVTGWESVTTGNAVRVYGYCHFVADSYWIGGAYAFQPEIALDLTIHITSFIGVDDIPAAGIFYDKSFHDYSPITVTTILRGPP